MGPVIAFDPEDVDAAAHARMRELCREHGFLPFFDHGIVLDVGLVDGGADKVALLRRLTHREVRSFLIAPGDFARAMAALESGPTAAPPRTSPSGAPRWPESWDFRKDGPRGAAVEMVRLAFEAGASDLILDAQEEWLEVAVKRHGRKEILPPVGREAAAGLLRAFKEMAGMAVHATGGWLSGSARVPLGGSGRADLRVETAPTLHGESLVARIQDPRRLLERMGALPFSDPGQLRLARACLALRQGLLVVTGPTGHGKTATLYACLGQLDRSALNIRTLEDPVEFAVPWITQTTVEAGTRRTYAEGLKSLLRQAPDVILLGELRDRETARVCMEAVDTGHLVLTTLHTSDAAGVVARLLDLGVSGRQIAATLTLAVGQRLLRRLCPDCRREAPPTGEELRHFERYGLPAPPRLWRRAGCPSCGGLGEDGLVAVFEFFHPGGRADLAEAIARADLRSLDQGALRARWLEGGGSPLVREGLKRAAAGETAVDEALRHERDPDA